MFWATYLFTSYTSLQDLKAENDITLQVNKFILTWAE